MHFCIRNYKTSEDIQATFVGAPYLDHSYIKDNKIFGDCWLKFAKTKNFKSKIQKNLIYYLCKFVSYEFEESDVTIEWSDREYYILIVYYNKTQCYELDITRYGFEIRGEPLESIYIMDLKSFEIAC